MVFIGTAVDMGAHDTADAVQIQRASGAGIAAGIDTGRGCLKAEVVGGAIDELGGIGETGHNRFKAAIGGNAAVIRNAMVAADFISTASSPVIVDDGIIKDTGVIAVDATIIIQGAVFSNRAVGDRAAAGITVHTAAITLADIAVHETIVHRAVTGIDGNTAAGILSIITDDDAMVHGAAVIEDDPAAGAVGAVSAVTVDSRIADGRIFSAKDSTAVIIGSVTQERTVFDNGAVTGMNAAASRTGIVPSNRTPGHEAVPHKNAPTFTGRIADDLAGSDNAIQIHVGTTAITMSIVMDQDAIGDSTAFLEINTAAGAVNCCITGSVCPAAGNSEAGDFCAGGQHGTADGIGAMGAG